MVSTNTQCLYPVIRSASTHKNIHSQMLIVSAQLCCPLQEVHNFQNTANLLVSRSTHCMEFIKIRICLNYSKQSVRYSFIEIWVNNTNEIKYKIKYSTNDPQSFHLLFMSHKHSVSLTQSTLDDTKHTVNQ